MFISSLSKLALYGGVTERFKRKAKRKIWLVEDWDTIGLVTHCNMTWAWRDDSSYSSCAERAVGWKAQSSRIISTWSTPTAEDPYSPSFRCCSTTQPYCKKALANLLYLDRYIRQYLVQRIGNQGTLWDCFVRVLASSLCYTMWLYQKVSLVGLSRDMNLRTSFWICQVHSNRLRDSSLNSMTPWSSFMMALPAASIQRSLKTSTLLVE